MGGKDGAISSVSPEQHVIFQSDGEGMVDTICQQNLPIHGQLILMCYAHSQCMITITAKVNND